MIPTAEVEYVTAAEQAAADRLASVLAELITNWSSNNGSANPYVICGALGHLIAVCLLSCPDDEHRMTGTVSVLDMILGSANVDRQEVLQNLMMLSGRTFDA